MSASSAGYIDSLFHLAGRVALVTGAKNGIGAEIAFALSAAGAQVALTGRQAEDLEAAVARIRDHGGEALALGCDVRDLEATKAAIETVHARWGRLDILVNNAAVTLREAAFDYREEKWDEVLDTNLKAAFFASREAARHMVRERWGRIVNVSSMYASVAHAERAAYVASKAGLEGLTRALAAEWGPFGVTVNALAPGTTLTPSREFNLLHDQEFVARRLEKIPLRRLGKPSEMAAAALFLVGEGGAFTTGHTLVVDGGYSIV